MRADVARLRSERESPVDDNFELARCGAVRCGAARLSLRVIVAEVVVVELDIC